MVLQGFGLPYSETAPEEVTNQLRVVIENRSGRDAVYKIEIAGGAEAHFAVPPEAMRLARRGGRPRRCWRLWPQQRPSSKVKSRHQAPRIG